MHYLPPDFKLFRERFRDRLERNFRKGEILKSIHILSVLFQSRNISNVYSSMFIVELNFCSIGFEGTNVIRPNVPVAQAERPVCTVHDIKQEVNPPMT